jgi:hypothetical protein
MNDTKFMQTNTTLAMSCSVAVNIGANAQVVWGLLTDAKGFPRWNSTITGIEGQIREGERLRLHVPGTRRTFTPRVSDVVAARRMTWSDGFVPLFKGVRSFELKPRDDGSTDFVMKERFSGIVFALTRRMLPDFRPIFEAYAGDLKREAERIGPERGIVEI